MTRLLRRAWPPLAVVAGLYRRSIVRRTRFVAVIGSLGKTTAARAVTVALGQAPHRWIGLNAHALVALQILRVRPGRHHAVLEVGISGPGQMARYARVMKPDMVIVTGIASEHGRAFATLENTRAEKAHMVRALGPESVAVLNGDDPHVRWMATQTAARIVTFGLDATNDVRATEVTLDWPHGTRFLLHTPGECRTVRIRLIGRPMVMAILAAVAVALTEGRRLEAILPPLERLGPTPGRLEPVLLPGGAVLLRDDFKSAIETVEAALDTLAEVPARRRIVVLGEVSEPGRDPRTAYRRLGARIAEVASEAIFVAGDSARSYAAGARSRGLRPDKILRAGPGFRRAVTALAARLGPGDVVLIKGRNDQRLERIALALQGRRVRCEIRRCGAVWTACDRCQMLERGWDGRRVIV